MRAIFIVGTGRSGTHFLTRLLSGFPQINDPLDGKENINLLKEIATNALLHKKPSDSILEYYKRAIENSAGRVFLDQHHPNLFFAECYFNEYGDIIYLFPQRSTAQIVSSMMKYSGVLGWGKFALQNKKIVPFPNQFLGLVGVKQISELPLHLLCASRVISHKNYFRMIREKFGAQRVREISYKELVMSPEAELRKVFTDDEISLLGDFILKEKPNQDSLSKFLEHLSAEQIKEIEELEKATLEI